MHSPTYNSPFLFLISGPPRSGKDTIAEILHRRIPRSDYLRVSLPLKAAAAPLLQAPLDAKQNLVLDDKDAPVSDLHNISARELQINYFRYLAKEFGESVLAYAFIRNARLFKGPVLLVPDCGRQVEYDIIAEAFPHAYLPVYRPGTTYTGDSRHRIESFDSRYTWRIENDQSINALENKLADLIRLLRESGDLKV